MISIRVLKIGGSLFRYPWLPSALGDWSSQQDRKVNIAVSGGGPWADEIRNLESDGQLTEEEAHWSAIRTMSWSSIWLASQVAESRHTSFFHDLRMLGPRHRFPNLVFFDPFLWLSHVEPFLHGPKLPIGWQTTSDSIAARLAQTLDVELVVLKSVPFEYDSISDAVAAGYVDEWFSKIVSPNTAVQFVDFPGWNRNENSGRSQDQRQLRSNITASGCPE